MFSRRQFLSGSGAAITAATLNSGLWASEPITVVRAGPSVAPILEPTADPVPVWAYQGRVPGPVIRARKGDTVRVRLQNDLPQPTSIHWHGIRIENAMDGVSGLTQAPAAPGGSFEYRFTVPDAGTFWYHPHHRSWEQMARGLYGLLVVEESEPTAFDRDLVFVADDWRIGEDGAIDTRSFGNMGDWSHGGRLGNWLTINGRAQPRFAVKAGERIRLRCVNVANARILAFDFGALAPLVIALDGQPIPLDPSGTDPLVIAPAQRADLLIDVPRQPGARIPVHLLDGRDRYEAATFVVAKEPTDIPPDRSEPRPLPANPLRASLDIADAQQVSLLMEGGAMGGMRAAYLDGKQLDIRELVAQGMVWSFNGVAGRPREPLARIPRGRTAVIDITNRTAWPHAMHLHGHHFRIIERNGNAVSDAPWRDTELVDADERVRIGFVADNPGKWLLHCHMLEHQAAGMVTWIKVV